MNTRSSSYTGRAARTLQQAFGEYTSYSIEEQKADYAAGWWAALAICFIVTLVLIVATA